MKALIISDIHSNIYALEAIWAQERDNDIIYCAGDLVDYGPFPKEVLDWVRAQTFCSPKNDPITRLILGHTHRQVIRHLSDTLLWLNPGSALYRRRDDPDQTAHYATITDGVISLRRVPYNLEPLRRYVGQVCLKESEVSVAEHIFGPRETSPEVDG